MAKLLSVYFFCLLFYYRLELVVVASANSEFDTNDVDASTPVSSTTVGSSVPSEVSTAVDSDNPTSKTTEAASTTTSTTTSTSTSTTTSTTTSTSTTTETTTVTVLYVPQQHSFSWDSSENPNKEVVFPAPEGCFISVTVSNVSLLDGNYLLIEGGDSHTEDATDGRVFANNVAGPLLYLFRTTSVYATYEILDNDMSSNTFTVSFEETCEPTTTPPMTTTTPLSLPTTEKGDSIYVTVNVSGKSWRDYDEALIDAFKGCVVTMATNYCIHEKILLTQNITKDYVILREYGINPCPLFWPGSEACVRITFKLPVFPKEHSGYELTAEHLEIMWLRSDQFDDQCLKKNYLSVYIEPDIDRSIMWWAIGVSLVIAALVILLWFLRSFSSKVIRSAIKKSQNARDSETKSIISDRKESISSLTPHYLQDHLDTPKLFEP